MTYLPRIVDSNVSQRLASSGAVVLEGARACGKTATGLQHSESAVFLDTDENARTLYSVAPARLLEGPQPRLLDEWQTAPELWNHVRRRVDMAGAGQFILTGSAVPADDVTRHSGAGRFSHITMRTMSTAERHPTRTTVSLSDLMTGGTSSGASSASLDFWVEEIVRGGWPATVKAPVNDARQSVVDYVRDTARVDVGRLVKRNVDPIRVADLLTAVARNTACDTNNKNLAQDASLGRETVASYLDALARIHVFEPQPAWGPHLRSRSRVRAAAKLHFVDPSVSVAALNADQESLLADVSFVGTLFESLAVRDLRVYSERLGVHKGIKHYRDNTGLEADIIVDAGHRRWVACEVKLSSRSEVVETAAENLRSIAERVDGERMGPPSAMIVLTGGGYAYTRDDGIHVVPLDVLGP